MSDVSLTSELSLDVNRALLEIDRLAESLQRATTNVVISADASAVTVAIEAAVQSANVSLAVEADTSAAEAAIANLGDELAGIAGEGSTDVVEAALADVAAAADSADSAVAGLGENVSGLGDASASAAPQVKETADASVALSAGAGAAAGDAGGLLDVLGEIGPAAGAAAGALAAVATVTALAFGNAVEAQGATERFDAALGNLADRVDTLDIGNLNTDISTLAIQLGASDDAMRNAAATMAQLGVSSGATAQQAALVSEQVLVLAARAVALNPALGDVGQVADGMGNALARGGRFANNFNISLTPLEIQLRALADTGKETTAELTRFELTAAGAALAVEKYGSTLDQVITQGSQNAVVELSSLKTAFEESIEAIGAPLVAPVFELLRTSLPLATDLAQAFGSVAAGLIPVLQVIVDLLGLIPQPVITAGVAFLTMRAILAAVSTAMLAYATNAGTAALATTLVGGAATALSAAIIPLAVAFAAYTVVQGINASQTAEQTAQHQRLLAVLDDVGAAADNVAGFVRELAEDDATRSIVELAGGSRALADALTSTGGGLTDFLDALAGVSPEAASAAHAISVIAIALGQSAYDSLAAGVATGQWTEAQVEAAKAAVGYSGQINENIAVLDELESTVGAATAAEEEHNEQLERSTELLAEMAAGEGYVIAALQGVQGSVGDTTDELLGLAVAVDQANLSQEQMQAVADGLGVTVEQLAGFVTAAGQAITGFASAATGGMPTVESAVRDVVAEAERLDDPFDPAKLVEALNARTIAITGYRDNIDLLLTSGFENIAAHADELGAEAVAAIAAGIRDGTPEVADGLNAAFAYADIAAADVATHGPQWGAEIAVATGEAGRIASDAFGNQFLLTEPTQAQMDRARLTAELAGIPLAEALALVASDAGVAFDTNLGIIVPAAGAAVEGAAEAASTKQQGKQLRIELERVGESGAEGFEAGLSPTPSIASTTVLAAIAAASAAGGGAYVTGFTIGFQLMSGMASGIRAGSVVAAIAAAAAVRAAVDAAQAAAGIRSPSTVFAHLGEQVGLGFALGIDATADAVATAMRGVVSAAIPSVPVAGSSAASAWTAGIVFAAGSIVVSLPPGSTPSDAEVAGERVARGITRVLGLHDLHVEVRARG